MDLGYLSLIFCSTLLIYSLHRIVGIKSTVPPSDQGRFFVIRKYRSHISIYAVLAFIGCLVSIIFTPLYMIYCLFPTSIISFAYVLPLLKSQRRLRDLNYIKIVLIAITWAYAACIPLIINELPVSQIVISFIEKVIFILLITLPFDIRDIKIDRLANLKTIPMALGLKNTYRLCYLLLILGLVFFYLLEQPSLVSPIFVNTGLIIYAITFFAIELSKNKHDDIYYSGLVDGTLVARGLVVILAIEINNLI